MILIVFVGATAAAVFMAALALIPLGFRGGDKPDDVRLLSVTAQAEPRAVTAIVANPALGRGIRWVVERGLDDVGLWGC